MKYMLIHCVNDEIAEQTELASDTASSLSSWLDEMSRRGVLLHGDRLRPARDAVTVRVRRGDLLIADGPFAETKSRSAPSWAAGNDLPGLRLPNVQEVELPARGAGCPSAAVAFVG